MTTPLSGDAFRFVVPQIVVPGEPFTLEATISNPTPDTLSGVKVEIHAPHGATLVRGTAKLGSRVLRMKDERTFVTLPPLKSGTETMLRVEAIVEPPADDGAVFVFRAESTAHGAAREIEQQATIRADVAFDPDSTVLLIDHTAVAPGEQRVAVASIVNVGTMTARDVRIRLSVTGAVVEQGETIRVQDLLPNDVVEIPFSLIVDPADRTERGEVFVGAEVLVGSGVVHTFDGASLTIVPPARFSSGGSALIVDGETTRAAGPLPVTIRLRNEGERPARDVEARLVLAGGIEAPQGAVVRFATIDPGASVETPMLLAATATGSIQLLVGDVLLGEFTIEIGSTPSLVPFRFEKDLEEVTVGGTVGFRFDALSNGYASVNKAEFSVTHGAGLAFLRDSLHVNGFQVDGDAVALAEIEPGAVVSLAWRARAMSPTLHGTTTTAAVRFSYGDDIQTAPIAPFSITPAAIFPEQATALPFKITGSAASSRAVQPVAGSAESTEPAPPYVAAAPEPGNEKPSADQVSGQQTAAQTSEANVSEITGAPANVVEDSSSDPSFVSFSDDGPQDESQGADAGEAASGENTLDSEQGDEQRVEMDVVLAASRVTETVMPLCGNDLPFPVLAHVATIAMLADGNDDPTFSVAVDALRTLVQQAAQTRRATRNRQTAKVDMVARFRQTAEPIVSLVNLSQFPSAASGEASAIAVVAAIAMLTESHPAWAAEARNYLSGFIANAEALDALDDAAFAKRLGGDDLSILDDALLGVLTRVKSVVPGTLAAA